ncbi:helix-turn-helix transcriptional regulator [Actinoplanes sp. CA-030573]|uniref:helix-turn-helix transcriptional regulator n=1 Tax=Actinoplanes sp. CA-030573 TaxID=3239898 RepID=UPI003D8BBEB2
MRVRSKPKHPLLRFSVADATTFTIHTMRQSAVLDLQIEPLNMVTVCRLVSAHLHHSRGGSDQRYGPGDLCLGVYQDRQYTARMQPGEYTSCLLDLTELAKVAATAPNRRPQSIRFTSLNPVSAAAAEQWWNARTYAADLLDSPAASTPLVLATVTQLLAAATLTAFPNTALTDPTIEDRHDAHPASLRRAISFVDDNAHRTISPADIAAAAHVSIRALQLAFRRHLDTTPAGYLRRVRLEHAHRDLRTADPSTGATVGAIAARWGFVDQSRFSADYRAAYGIPPSMTLRSR